MGEHFHTDGLIRDAQVGSSAQNVALNIIGCHIGEQAVMQGLPETARRLTHALAEIAAALDTDFPSAAQCKSARGVLAQKAKDTLREWGVV